MKRTIEEIHNLVKDKIENAENALIRERNRIYPSKKNEYLLLGQIQAYKDIDILLSTSHLKENKNGKNN